MRNASIGKAAAPSYPFLAVVFTPGSTESAGREVRDVLGNND
jgi:hypothetical protein